MMRKGVKSVEKYLKDLPKDQKSALQKLRKTIKSSAPKAEEKISYQIPSYFYKGKPLVYFAAQKTFLSLYGVGHAMARQFKKELKDFEISGTSIHFTPDHSLPVRLVQKMVRFRISLIDQGKVVRGAQKPRARVRMSTAVKVALEKARVMNAYSERPPYQRNDYLGWIQSAKLQATKDKRLDQMLKELRKGNVYMGMKWSPRRK